MNPKVFSDNLKKFRTENGYSPEQIAHMLGVSPAYIYRWEYQNALSDSLYKEILNKNY